MALLDYVDPDVDDDRLRALFAADAETYGRPSLFARVLANNPDVLAARQAYVTSLREAGTLDETLAELAYVAVAAANDCEYCAASHAERLVEHVGVPEADVAALRTGDLARFDERQRAVVRFARAAATDPKRVDADDVAALRDVGFDDAAVVELVTLVAAAVAATVVADVLDIHPADATPADENGNPFHE